MKEKSQKILCAMSGGVDSSVAAALLVEQGHDVTGAYMVNYDDKPMDETLASCWTGDYRDALRVAAKLGIPLMRLDFTKEYERDVLQYMYQEYERGNTPNPDVLCNKFVKFGAWLNKALELGFDYMVTGHYARSEEKNGIIKLLVAKDDNKDQTYFLHQLTQDQLRHALFPVGEYTKTEVRALAEKFGLPTARKEESMGICFVGEVPMKEFLMRKIRPQKGSVVLSPHARESVGDTSPPRRGENRGGGKMEVIGEHDGLPFYTIGQRHANLRLQTSDFRFRNEPLFVVAKNPEANELVVGYKDDPLLYTSEITVKDVNWIHGQTPDFPLECLVRTRHRQPLQKAHISPHARGGEKEGAGVIVRFTEPQRAITPGQFAVFYKDGECLGGGVIY